MNHQIKKVKMSGLSKGQVQGRMLNISLHIVYACVQDYWQDLVLARGLSWTPCLPCQLSQNSQRVRTDISW